MRIAHVFNWYIPGLGYEENHLPAAQASNGHEVFLLASNRLPHVLMQASHFRGLYPEGAISESSFTDGNLEVRRLPCTPEIRGQIALIGLRDSLAEFGPEVVHSHGVSSMPSLQSLFLQKRMKFKLFIDDHTNLSNLRIDEFITRSLVRAIRGIHSLMESCVAHYISVTPASARILVRYFGISPSRIYLSSLGVDTETFRPSQRIRASTRNLLGVQKGETLIVYAGKFSRAKKIHTLLTAFSYVSSRHPNTKLMLAGDGPPQYIDFLRDRAVRLDISDRVVFRGLLPHSNLPLFYNGADIGVWPGSHSITVLEALACGLPCVVPSDEAAYLSELQNDALIGFSGGGTKSLEQSLENLMSDSGLRRRISDCARKYAEEQLSWNVIASRLVELYKTRAG